MTTAQENLDVLKALCVEGETPDQHAQHAAELEAAYAAFAQGEPSNPAPPGVTEITADVVVNSEAGPPA